MYVFGFELLRQNKEKNKANFIHLSNVTTIHLITKARSLDISYSLSMVSPGKEVAYLPMPVPSGIYLLSSP